MKTEDTKMLRRQRAKPSKSNTADRPLYTIITVHNTVAQRQFLFNIPLPPDQHHISDVAKWR